MSSLKQILRNNPTFRAIFALPILWRSKFINRGARAFADRYRAHVLGGKIVVRAANLSGDFSVSAQSDLAVRILHSGNYEPSISALIDGYSNLGGTVLNVGANVGLLAVHIAKTFKRIESVIAIEPNPEAFQLLSENIERNGARNLIRAVETCAGAEKGEVTLNFIPGMAEYSSTAKIAHLSAMNQAALSVTVPCAPVDDLVPNSDRVSMILMDVEGAEHIALSGADRILSRDKPVLIFECSDRLLRGAGSGSRKLEDFLKKYGYSLTDAESKGVKLQHPFNGEVLGLHSSA